MANRWWVYQRERFPVLAHGLLIAAFSFSAVSFSALLRGPGTYPAWQSAAVAFVTSFIFFLQLRIADEFKDFDEDAKYRPYRPVPRGLVTLKELGLVGMGGAAVQLLLALWREPTLALWLAVVWLYLALMSKEFFVGRWLRHQHVLYMLSHMLILPLVDLYATACDWWPAQQRAPHGLLWFLIVSYFNGIVLEVGRKIRAPEDEEVGVSTYSHLWGRKRAVLAWLGALLVTTLSAILAAREIRFVLPVVALLGFLLMIAGLLSRRFLVKPTTGRAKLIEGFSGVWTLLMYLSLGAVPLLAQALGK
ncbi:MAG: UbiA family prenyltransferase [Gemmataceae bacterium]